MGLIEMVNTVSPINRTLVGSICQRLVPAFDPEQVRSNSFKTTSQKKSPASTGRANQEQHNP